MAILDAAIAIFAEKGYRGADVQLIADRVGVGKGTVYRNYGTKEDLFWAAVAEVNARIKRHVSEGLQRPIAGIADFFRIIAIRFAECYEQFPDYMALGLLARSEFLGDSPEQHREERIKAFETLISRVEEVLGSSELQRFNAKDVAAAFIAMLEGVVLLHCYAEHMAWPKSLVELMRNSVEVFLQGLNPTDIPA